MLDRREDTLDRVGRSQVNPMLSREVIECEQFFTIFLQAVSRFRVLGLVSFDEQIECLVSMLSGSSHPDLMQLLLGAGLQPLGQLVQHTATFVKTVPLFSCLGKDFWQGLPETRAPSPVANFGSTERPRAFTSSKSSFQLCLLSR